MKLTGKKRRQVMLIDEPEIHEDLAELSASFLLFVKRPLELLFLDQPAGNAAPGLSSSFPNCGILLISFICVEINIAAIVQIIPNIRCLGKRIFGITSNTFEEFQVYYDQEDGDRSSINTEVLVDQR
jgi:hypothetical protein